MLPVQCMGWHQAEVPMSRASASACGAQSITSKLSSCKQRVVRFACTLLRSRPASTPAASRYPPDAGYPMVCTTVPGLCCASGTFHTCSAGSRANGTCTLEDKAGVRHASGFCTFLVVLDSKARGTREGHGRAAGDEARTAARVAAEGSKSERNQSTTSRRSGRKGLGC